MKNLKATLIVLTGSFLIAACGDDRFPDYRYKMTVYVGDKAFSSVREVSVSEVATIQDSSGKTLRYSLIGEAVVIDIPGQSPAFALLSKPDNADYGIGAAEGALRPVLTPEEKAAPDERELYYQRLAAIKGPQTLPRTRPNPNIHRSDLPPIQLWPMFVRFGDIDDPKTVREVSATELGVKRITIEITQEDVTTGIEQRLGWLSSLRGAIVKTPPGKSMFDKPDVHRLAEGSFWTGAKQ